MKELYFWSDELSQCSYGSEITLSKEESHHIQNVLRIPEGTEIFLMDGCGWIVKSTIIQHSKKATEVKVIEKNYHERTTQLKVIGPAPKGKRLPYLMEKLQEIGVSSWQSLKCEHGVREEISKNEMKKLNERFKSACKQSRNPWLMTFEPSVSWDELKAKKQVAILDLDGGYVRTSLGFDKSEEIFLVYGPEAGFCQSEREEIRNSPWKRIKLSPNHLRMETAALLGSGRLLESLYE